MTKDEIKNRISMALKDPILQQGFEIICKENAELKKENASIQQSHMDVYNDMRAYKDELIKAKEIIKKYLIIGVGGKITQNYLDVTKEAEQFLKECEE